MAAVLDQETAGPATERPAVTRPRVVPEVVRGLAVFAVYLVVNALDWPGRASTARAHAHDILSLEQRLHLDPEPALNRWLAPHHTLRVLANYEYATTYVISAFALLCWLYRRARSVYAWARTSFIWLNLVAIACFAAYPLTPPRLAGQGFVDTVWLGHTWGSWGSPLVGHANQLAAMPSLHFGWALWVSAVLARSPAVARAAGQRGARADDAVGHPCDRQPLPARRARRCRPGRRLREAHPAAGGDRVAAADAFFLHVETPAAPQHVGGVVLLDLIRPEGCRLTGTTWWRWSAAGWPSCRGSGRCSRGAEPRGVKPSWWRWRRQTWYATDDSTGRGTFRWST